MTFKEFIELDELVGAYGSIKHIQGPLGLHLSSKKLLVPKCRHKGASRVKKALAAGKVTSPSRPSVMTFPNRPMMIGSNF